MAAIGQLPFEHDRSKSASKLATLLGRLRGEIMVEDVLRLGGRRSGDIFRVGRRGGGSDNRYGISMDALIAAAARALAAGDPFGALNRVALRDDAPALALRGIALAQLGDFERARMLLRRATRGFSPRETVARARCVVAEAEIAFASRDLGWAPKALDAARATLENHGDAVNAAHARYLEIRRLLLIGRLGEAARLLAAIDPMPLPPALRTTHELIVAGIAIRRLQTAAARAALGRAERAAAEAAIPALTAELENTANVLNAPAARLIAKEGEHLLRLEDVENLLASKMIVIDACRYAVRHGGIVIALARRPVLFALIRALGEAWPQDVSRSKLLAHAFGAKFADESHRARLRVEIGRLRAAIKKLGEVKATAEGFVFVPRLADKLAVLARPVEEEHGSVLAFLADGELWSSSALALALDTSARTVQRALEELAGEGKVRWFGRGRARRWMTPPPPGFTTTLLLPAPLPGD